MTSNILQWIMTIPVVLLAITIHEYAHGKAALLLGDPTAKSMGRLTLNPLPHIDPMGAICLFLFHFGWAKPVPVNPRYFANPRRDVMIMSLAGPLSNLTAAFLTGMLLRIILQPEEVSLPVVVCFLFMQMNIGLGLFNLLPIPPLDGSHILENILNARSALKYREFARYGPIILIGIVLLDNFAHTGILSRLLIGPMNFLVRLFAGI